MKHTFLKFAYCIALFGSFANTQADQDCGTFRFLSPLDRAEQGLARYFDTFTESQKAIYPLVESAFLDSFNRQLDYLIKVENCSFDEAMCRALKSVHAAVKKQFEEKLITPLTRRFNLDTEEEMALREDIQKALDHARDVYSCHWRYGDLE